MYVKIFSSKGERHSKMWQIQSPMPSTRHMPGPQVVCRLWDSIQHIEVKQVSSISKSLFLYPYISHIFLIIIQPSCLPLVAPFRKPKWTTWAPWSSCDVTCGGGTQFRSRTCTDSIPADDIICVGKPSEQQGCSTWDCPGRYQKCLYNDSNWVA